MLHNDLFLLHVYLPLLVLLILSCLHSCRSLPRLLLVALKLSLELVEDLLEPLGVVDPCEILEVSHCLNLICEDCARDVFIEQHVVEE